MQTVLSLALVFKDTRKHVGNSRPVVMRMTDLGPSREAWIPFHIFAILLY